MGPPHRFSPLTTRGTTIRNRIMISPMCQYSAREGEARAWHLVHLGRFALGGAGIVCAEATAVEERGRISHFDLGLYRDTHATALAPVASFLLENRAVPAIQLSHAGRKAGARTAWEGASPLTRDDAGRGQHPWPTVGPSAVAAEGGWPIPEELSVVSH